MFGRNLLSTRAREPFEPSKDVENLSSFDYEMLGSFRLAVFVDYIITGVGLGFLDDVIGP